MAASTNLQMQVRNRDSQQAFTLVPKRSDRHIMAKPVQQSLQQSPRALSSSVVQQNNKHSLNLQAGTQQTTAANQKTVSMSLQQMLQSPIVKTQSPAVPNKSQRSFSSVYGQRRQQEEDTVVMHGEATHP